MEDMVWEHQGDLGQRVPPGGDTVPLMVAARIPGGGCRVLLVGTCPRKPQVFGKNIRSEPALGLERALFICVRRSLGPVLANSFLFRIWA